MFISCTLRIFKNKIFILENIFVFLLIYITHQFCSQVDYQVLVFDDILFGNSFTLKVLHIPLSIYLGTNLLLPSKLHISKSTSYSIFYKFIIFNFKLKYTQKIGCSFISQLMVFLYIQKCFSSLIKSSFLSNQHFSTFSQFPLQLNQKYEICNCKHLWK